LELPVHSTGLARHGRGCGESPLGQIEAAGSLILRVGREVHQIEIEGVVPARRKLPRTPAVCRVVGSGHPDSHSALPGNTHESHAGIRLEVLPRERRC